MTRWVLALLLIALPAMAQDYNVPGRPAASGTTYWSLLLNGTDEYTRTTTAVSLGIGADFSISYWVKPSALTASMWFSDLRGAAGAYTSAVIAAINGNAGNDPLRVRVYDTGGTLLKDYSYINTTPNPDESWFVQDAWTHIVITYTSTGTGTLTVYFDGTAHAATTVTTDNDVNTSTENRVISYGSDSASTNRFAGNIGPMAIWSSVLGADEVAAIYAGKFAFDVQTDSGNYVSSANAVHWMRLCQDRTSIVTALKDYIGTIDLAEGDSGLVVGDNCVEVAP